MFGTEIAHADAVAGGSGWTCGETMPGSVTIDAGTSRWFAVLVVEEDDGGAADGVITTIGGQAPDQTDEVSFTGLTGDGFGEFFLFDEASIDAMSGTTVVYTDSSSTNYWCYGTILDTDQTAITEWFDTAAGDGSAGVAVGTGTDTDDYSVVIGINVQNEAYASWDMLSELVDVDGTGHRIGLGAGNVNDSATTVTNSGGASGLALFSLVFSAAASAPAYSSGPTLSGVTDGFRIAGTLDQTADVYFAAYLPAATGPADCDALITAVGAMSPPIYGTEEWTADTADTLDITASGAWPEYDLYHCVDNTNGQVALAASANQNRAEDTGQTIVRLTSTLSGTAFVVPQTVSGCDTDGSTAVITGCSGTEWIIPGMRVTVSAGFASTGPYIVEAVDSTTIELEIASNSMQSNITTTEATYFSPAVAQNDVLEGDDTNNEGDTITIGTDGELTCTDCTVGFWTWDYNVQDVSDTSDGDFDSGPPAWATGDDRLYVNASRPVIDSDVATDPYLFYVGEDIGSVPLDCADDTNGQTATVSSRDSAPSGITLSSNALTGTPDTEDESGWSMELDCVAADLYATPATITGYTTDDEVTMPDLTGGTFSAALTTFLTSFPWQSGDPLLTISGYTNDCTATIGDVVSQSPVAMATAEALQVATVVLATCNRGRPGLSRGVPLGL